MAATSVPAPALAPLPPSELFAPMPERPVALPPPDFDHLVPTDPLGLARRMQEATDRSDAAAATAPLRNALAEDDELALALLLQDGL